MSNTLSAQEKIKSAVMEISFGDRPTSTSRQYLLDKTKLEGSEIWAAMMDLRDKGEVVIYEENYDTFGLNPSFFL